MPGVDGISIAAGDTYVLSPEEQVIVLGTLIMGDSATLIVPSSFGFWRAHVERASFGRNCRIIAMGEQGPDNNAVAPAPRNPGGKCTAIDTFVASGSPAPLGGRGSNGVNILLKLGVESVGDLTIDVSGGNGGASGTASRGAKGRRGSCTYGCHGQRGGKGGDGSQSSGGDGGNIELQYWVVAPVGVPTGNLPAGIRLVSYGGSPGPASPPALGGFGGDGKKCVLRKSRRKGKVGLPGSIRRGFSGNGGDRNIKAIAQPISVAWVETTE